MAKKQITVRIDEGLLRSVEDLAAQRGSDIQEVIEELLSRYFLAEVLEGARSRSTLGEDEALELAYEELHRARSESR
jgi:hypothetical protein